MMCNHCERDKPDVHKRRQGSAYPNDESNFAIICDDCQKESDEYWKEMWNEYYSAVRG